MPILVDSAPEETKKSHAFHSLTHNEKYACANAKGVRSKIGKIVS